LGAYLADLRALALSARDLPDESGPDLMALGLGAADPTETPLRSHVIT
jgi:hypothetical protein